MPLTGEGLEAADEHAVAPDGLAVEGQVGDAGEHGVEHALGLEAGQVGAEAGVGAAAELEVVGDVGAVDHHRVGGVAPAARVPVGGGQAHVEHGARRDLGVLEHHRLRGDPSHELVGTVVAEQFGHRSPQEGWFVAQASELVGVAEQGEHAVAHQAGGGFVAGHVQGDELGHQLVVGQALAVDLGGDQVGEQVTGGGLAAKGDLGVEVVVHGVEGGEELGALLGREGVPTAGHPAGPGAELGGVLLGDAEPAREDLHRQRVGEVGHQVDPGTTGGPLLVGEAVGGGGDPFVDEGVEAVHLAHPEGFGHEAADPAVVGVVEVDDGAGGPHVVGQGLELELGDGGGGGPGHVAGHGGLAQHRGHVVVAGDHPTPQQLGPVDRVLVA